MHAEQFTVKNCERRRTGGPKFGVLVVSPFKIFALVVGFALHKPQLAVLPKAFMESIKLISVHDKSRRTGRSVVGVRVLRGFPLILLETGVPDPPGRSMSEGIGLIAFVHGV